MEIEIITHSDVRILACVSSVTSVEDALELVAASSEQNCRSLLLEAHILPDSFFDLRTQFAGDFLQKLLNYRLRTAGVFPPDREYKERFKEFLAEARRGTTFRAFGSRHEALNWLAAESTK
jgi:hypothetical protein